PFRLRQFPFREQGFRDLIAQLVQFAQLSNEIGSGVRDGCDASLKRAYLRPPELTRKLQMEAQTYPGRKRASGDSRRHQAAAPPRSRTQKSSHEFNSVRERISIGI